MFVEQHPAATHLILIRHGETAWNVERRLQGHLDVPLNDEGRRQAARVGLALADEPVVAVIASDLSRARTTAEAVAAHHGLEVFTDIRLRERTYGVMEGLSYGEAANRFPALYAAWQQRELDNDLDGGESLRQFSARVMAAVTDAASAWNGRRVVLVAHGGVLDCIYRAATGLPLEAPRRHALLNASINRCIAHDGKLDVLEWGEVSHLEAETLDEVDSRVP